MLISGGKKNGEKTWQCNMCQLFTLVVQTVFVYVYTDLKMSDKNTDGYYTYLCISSNIDHMILI